MAKTVRLTASVLNEDGTGQNITFEQIGLDQAKTLELQGAAIYPMVQGVLGVTKGWFEQAVSATKGNG